MSKYYNRKKRKSKSEKIGFYTAFSICVIAVAMAVYSTYNTLNISSSDSSEKSSAPTQAQLVNEVVTGVTENVVEPTIGGVFEATYPTAISDEAEFPSEAETETTEDSTRDALQTMLSTELSLEFPTKTGTVLREYSTDSVYFKTLNVWRPHTGVDFATELGENVLAMCDGTVTKTFDDPIFGRTLEVSTNDAVCIYSGLGSLELAKGDKVSTGDKIGVAGTVPFEASEANHIHVSVKINGKYADPLSFIDNDR